MKYIELDVRNALIVHGYDEDNRPLEEEIREEQYIRKLVAIERIRSISEQYILVSSSHGREMYWEYVGNLSDIKTKLAESSLIID
ncbi:hypothetical protein [Teredinibacter haidensis]|uniref:hypothetical protein n=1 Tax=Teredinibacter haidensis TaxID=2731755 RepID=UPI0009490EF3|nr:hypothetical protein [Teredinibacter haidensis]